MTGNLIKNIGNNWKEIGGNGKKLEEMEGKRKEEIRKD